MLSEYQGPDLFYFSKSFPPILKIYEVCYDRGLNASMLSIISGRRWLRDYSCFLFSVELDNAAVSKKDKV